MDIPAPPAGHLAVTSDEGYDEGYGMATRRSIAPSGSSMSQAAQATAPALVKAQRGALV